MNKEENKTQATIEQPQTETPPTQTTETEVKPQPKEKKPVYKQWWFWLIIVLLIGAVAASSSSSNNSGEADKTNNPTKSQTEGTEETKKSEETSSAETTESTSDGGGYKVGETITYRDAKVTVTGVERNFSTGNQFITPEEGKEYVKVNIEIANTSNSKLHVATTNWKIQDSNGVIKDYDFSTTAMIDGALDSVELAGGGKVAGALIFEVPAGDNGLVLQYDHSFLSETVLIRL